MRYLEASGLGAVLHRMEQRRSGQGGDEEGQEEDVADADDVFSLLHATDFAHRLVHNILPPLKAGMIVLADRYVYTAFARDVVRGCDPRLGAASSTSSHRGRIGRSISMCRSMSAFSAIPCRAAQDQGLRSGHGPEPRHDHVESFKIFQGRILDEYQRIVGEYGLTEIDATQSIGEQQQIVRD